jgi:hypothetical protein
VPYNFFDSFFILVFSLPPPRVTLLSLLRIGLDFLFIELIVSVRGDFRRQIDSHVPMGKFDPVLPEQLLHHSEHLPSDDDLLSRNCFSQEFKSMLFFG